MRLISLLFLKKILHSRHGRRVILSTLNRDLEDEKREHGLTRERLIGARNISTELELLYKESQEQLSIAHKDLADANVTIQELKFQLSTFQNTLPEASPKFDDALSSALQDARQNWFNCIQALNQIRGALVPSFPEFDFSAADLQTRVQLFVATTPSNYFQIMNERDDFARANQDYAIDLRAMRAENYKLRVQAAAKHS